MRVQLARAKQKSKKEFPHNCFIISFLPYSLDQGAMFFYISNHELYCSFSQLDREFWMDG